MGIKGSSKGFTLIELAIVLVIVGLLLGTGVGLIGPLSKRAKLTESREILTQARQAFQGYVVKNGYLPVEGTYSTSNPVQAFQDVGTKGTDSWGRPIRYRVAAELAGPTRNACAANATTLTITDNGVQKQNIAFLLISGGGNYNIQTENTIHPVDAANIDDFPGDVNRPEEYDDLVAYVSLDEIRMQRNCPKELEITSPSSLPSATEDSYYSYQLLATGGFQPYTWSMTGTGYGLTLSTAGMLTGTVNFRTASNTGELDNCSENISLNVTVQDSSSPVQTRTKTIGIPLMPQPKKIMTESLPKGSEGAAYNVSLAGSGGRAAYSWSIPSGSLPPGLTMNGSGTISGTIATDPDCSPGLYNFTVSLSDTCGQPTYKGLSIAAEDPDCFAGGTGSTTTTVTNSTTTSSTTTTTTLGPGQQSITVYNNTKSTSVYYTISPPGTQCNSFGMTVSVSANHQLTIYTNPSCQNPPLNCSQSHAALKGIDQNGNNTVSLDQVSQKDGCVWVDN